MIKTVHESRPSPEAAVKSLIDQIESDGGQVLSIYREPLGGHTQLFAALPIELVEPTPFQRDVSDGHVRKIVKALEMSRV
jgi:ParB family transcriptional regulator, chromosome partitioning protein